MTLPKWVSEVQRRGSMITYKYLQYITLLISKKYRSQMVIRKMTSHYRRSTFKKRATTIELTSEFIQCGIKFILSRLFNCTLYQHLFYQIGPGLVEVAQKCPKPVKEIVEQTFDIKIFLSFFGRLVSKSAFSNVILQFSSTGVQMGGGEALNHNRGTFLKMKIFSFYQPDEAYVF